MQYHMMLGAFLLDPSEELYNIQRCGLCKHVTKTKCQSLYMVSMSAADQQLLSCLQKPHASA